MSYPGNSSLSQEIRNRILGTFDQTLQLAEQGTRQEALLGCDFILRLDPLFEPARSLQARLQSGDGPVDVGDLRTLLESGKGVDLKSLGAEVDSLDTADDLAGRMQEALEARHFQVVLELAGKNEEQIRKDPALQKLAESAQSRLEAAPYVRAFLESAAKAKEEGHTEEAERLAKKAASLDPSHPELQGLMDAPPAPETPAPVGSETVLVPTVPLPPTAGDLVIEAEPVTEAEPIFETVDGEDSTQEVDAIAFETEGDAVFAAEPEELGEEEAALDFGFEDEDDAIETDSVPALEEEPPLALGVGAPAAESDGETDSRILELLDEGQVAFDEGEYQAAIDAWSRIFLIDIDHAEAAQRIDEARGLKAEAERKIEELFRTGEGKLKTGDSEGAQAAFEQVLSIQPSHLAAREYLDQLASGTVPMGSAPDLAAVIASKVAEPEVDLEQEIMVPPEPRWDEAPEARPKAAASGPPRRLTLLAGGVGMVVIVAALFLFFRRDSLFPNASDAQSGAGTASSQADPIERATKLHREGKTKVAISQLKRLRPGSPHYEQAQALLSQWEAATAPGDIVPDTAPSVDVLARRANLLRRARSAEAEGAFIQASEIYREAEQLAALDGRDAQDRDRLQVRLEPFQEEVQLFRQGDCEFLIPTLWRMRESGSDQAVVDRLLGDCYYNLAVLDIQRNDLASASEKLQEALSIRPEDQMARRIQLFVETYDKRGEDLLYRIYVKYLPSR